VPAAELAAAPVDSRIVNTSPIFPSSTTPPQSALSVARSRRALMLFLLCAGITLAIFLWIHAMRMGWVRPRVAPIFHFLFIIQDYAGAICAALILIAAIFVPTRFPALALLRRLGSNPLAVAAVTTIALCIGTLTLYHDHPLSMDEYAPLFQSRAFAAGSLTGQFPPALLDWLIPPGFQNAFLYVSRESGEVASFYWPGHALLMTPFTLLGIPWACNAVLSGLTLLFIHRIAMRVFADEAAAGLALLLTISSPVFLADGISYYSMTAHMCVNSLFVLLLLDPTPRRLLAAGIVGSLALTLHNPVPHALFALPWLLWVATRPHAVRNLALLAAGYLPLSLLLGVGWWLFINGLAQEGVTAGNSGHVVSSFFRLPTEPVLVARLMGAAKVWLWAAPVLCALAAIGLWRWRRNTTICLLACSAALTFIGYLFIWPDQGHGWGFRYFHSAWLALPLLGAAALAAVPDAQPDEWHRDEDVRTYVVASTLLCLLAGVALRGMQIDRFISGHLAQLPQLPQGATAAERVVIVDPSYSFYGVDLVQNDPFLRGGTIMALTQGQERNAAFVQSIRPGYRRVALDHRGEIWVPAAAEPR
jgi:hypothetical protein